MEAKLPRYNITNNARGPRMVLTPGGGKTVRPEETIVMTLTENELKAAKPYVDNGDLTIVETDDDEAAAPASATFNATPSSDGASANPPGEKPKPVEGDVVDNENLDGDNERDVTHVQHLGFGRWFGMKGDEKVTEAMTRAEAEAFAEEHKVPIGSEPDPSANQSGDTDNETPPPGETSPPDETSATE